MRKLTQGMIALWLIVFLLSCSSGTTRLTSSNLDDDRPGTPVTDVLVLAIIDDLRVREIFEAYFVQRLNAVGIEAVSSAKELPVKVGTKLDKEAIIKVIDKHGNDTLAITHLVGMEETEVFSRDRPRYSGNYYGFYGYAWGYVYWPTIYGEKAKFSIETRLYDVKTESLIWKGESLTTNPETTGKAIGQVVDMIMQELNNNGLLPAEQ